MRPVMIPDSRVWDGPDGRPVDRRTLGAPRGHETTVTPVEVLYEPEPQSPPPGPGTIGDLGAQYHILCALEDGDLERLIVDPHVWLTFWGGVVPFALSLPGAERADELLAYKVQLDGEERIMDPADVQLIYRGDVTQT
jgi:hypothetical protein